MKAVSSDSTTRIHPLTYMTRPTHREILESPARFRVIAAARRSGKTSLLRSIAAIAARARLRSIWYIAPTWAQCKELFFEPFLDETRALRLVTKSNRSDLQIDCHGGARIMCKSAERPDLILGRGMNLVLLDEFQSMSHIVFDAVIRPAIADTLGRVVFAGTPRGTGNQMHEFYLRGFGDEWPTWSSWLLTAYEAGMIPVEELEESRREAEARGPTSTKLWKREFMADFSAFVGQVFEAWDRETMVVEDAPAEQDRVRAVMGVDWGFSESHAGVAEVCVLDTDGRWHVVEETRKTGRTIESYWVPEINRLAREWNVEKVWCDPARPDAIAALRRHGDRPEDMNVGEANNDVWSGIVTCATLIESGKLRVRNGCRGLTEEIPAYTWEQTREGHFREKPKKIRDDCVDALRYAMHSERTRVPVWGA